MTPKRATGRAAKNNAAGTSNRSNTSNWCRLMRFPEARGEVNQKTNLT
jgi:hypothetical protein